MMRKMIHTMIQSKKLQGITETKTALVRLHSVQVIKLSNEKGLWVAAPVISAEIGLINGKLTTSIVAPPPDFDCLRLFTTNMNN